MNVIFVLLDGLNIAAGETCMGYLSALTTAGRAVYGRVPCELPALSRPLYQCLLTGRPPLVSGIVHNTFWRPDPAPTIFHRARDAGLVTAAAAYHWFSELCNRAPWDPVRDRCVDDPGLPIMHGLFYCNDAYPDDHVFLDAASLRLRYRPHLLLAHCMGIDDAGHRAGADSAEYRNAARRADMLLARWMPGWLEEGCQVIVAGDHGMHADGMHNGPADQECLTPMWLAGRAFHDVAAPPPQAPGSAKMPKFL
ncbi:MAG: alkaline phosphatase family protein, partial [Desulfovibrionaceae bacterium]|nr:alkaline phosphatase family protein [Desulfovibrionaceae bacterium]